MRLNLYQIYFDNDSYNNCFKDPSWKLIYNETCSDTFENEVIKNTIPNEVCDYVGIFSHKFLTIPSKGTCKVKDKHHEVFLQYIKEHNLDCLSFFRSKTKQTIFHNEDALYYNRCFNDLLKHLGVRFRAEQTPRFVIMQNAFIMRTDLYKDYVENWLTPAIEFLETYKPSHKTIPTYKGYNYKPFILERLISTYIHLNKQINCKHYGQ